MEEHDREKEKEERERRPIAFVAMLLLTVTVVFCLLEVLLEIHSRETGFFLGRKWFTALTEEGNEENLLCYPSDSSFGFDINFISGSQSYRRIWENGKTPKENDPLMHPCCVCYGDMSIETREAAFKEETGESATGIAAIGDSFTFGEGVPQDSAYQAAATEILRNKGVPDARVWNLGKSGAGIEEIGGELFPVAMNLAPRAIVYLFVLDDPMAAPELDWKLTSINDFINYRALSENLWVNKGGRMFRVEFTTRHTTVHYQGFPVLHLWKTLEYG